jgi:hypothetical protein
MRGEDAMIYIIGIIILLLISYLIWSIYITPIVKKYSNKLSKKKNKKRR